MTRAVRSTRQRAAVSALLDRLDDFRSADTPGGAPSSLTAGVWAAETDDA